MFRNLVLGVMLTSVDADTLFPNITGGAGPRGDVSFLATLRALLHDVEGATIRFFYKDVSGYTDESSAIEKLPFEDNSLTVIATSEPVSPAIKGFTPRINFEAFFVGIIPGVKCYIDEERRRSVIVIPSVNVKKYHTVQSAIFAALPWYMGVKGDVDFSQKAMFCSILCGRKITADRKIETVSPEDAYAEYMEYIHEVESKFDFKTIRTRRLLDGIEKVVYKREIENARNNVGFLRSRISDLTARLEEESRALPIAIAKLSGLQNAMENAETGQILDYFLANKSIDLQAVDEDAITFTAKGYAVADPEEVDAVLRNESSAFDSNRTSDVDPSTMKRLVRKIFIDKDWKLRMCAAYELRVGCGMHGIKDYSFPEECAGYMPNQHINIYRCLGGYESAVAQAIQNGDTTFVLDMAAMSAISLSFNDPVVMGQFAKFLYGRPIECGRTDLPCIELPDGSVVRPSEALEIIKGEENENEQTD